MRTLLFLIKLKRLDEDIVSEAAATPQEIRHIVHGEAEEQDRSKRKQRRTVMISVGRATSRSMDHHLDEVEEVCARLKRKRFDEGTP
jgi:hypothetical protein